MTKNIFICFNYVMRITLLNSINSIFSPLNSRINSKSRNLKFKQEDFYVRIKGYGYNSNWAKKVIETADNVVKFIRQKCDFENTLKKISKGVTEANKLLPDTEKCLHTGVLRATRNGWKHTDLANDGSYFITTYGTNKDNKYKIYADRFEYTIKHPLKNPYKDIMLTCPMHECFCGKILLHPDGKYIDNSFNHVKSIYDDLYGKYISSGSVRKQNLQEINSSIAEIRWILAHTTPWERGSDAISNVFIRTIYKAMGIKSYPLKKNISLDLQAYCTNLGDYKNNFADYFIKKPKVIE